MSTPRERWLEAVTREKEIIRLQAAMKAAQTDEAHTEAETALYAYLDSLEAQDAAELAKLGYPQV